MPDRSGALRMLKVLALARASGCDEVQETRWPRQATRVPAGALERYVHPATALS